MVKNLITHIMIMREKFTTHASIKLNQSKCFKLSITKSMNPSSNVATIQVDYEENFRCFCQNEPQICQNIFKISPLHLTLWITQRHPYLQIWISYWSQFHLIPWNFTFLVIILRLSLKLKS